MRLDAHLPVHGRLPSAELGQGAGALPAAADDARPIIDGAGAGAGGGELGLGGGLLYVLHFEYAAKDEGVC